MWWAMQKCTPSAGSSLPIMQATAPNDASGGSPLVASGTFALRRARYHEDNFTVARAAAAETSKGIAPDERIHDPGEPGFRSGTKAVPLPYSGKFEAVRTIMIPYEASLNMVKPKT